MNETLDKRLQQELNSFKTLWKGGFYEGDVLAELHWSTYGSCGYMSVLHATYLRCIKPYVNQDSTVLEIGPGRGTWTKTMLHAKKIMVMDALSAEHNDFWNFIGEKPKIFLG